MANFRLNKKFKYVYYNATLYIIAVNLVIYSFLQFTDISISGRPLLYLLSLVPAWIGKGYVWQYVTYMFVHVDFWHILFNMYILFMFGSMLERSLGSREFLLFYFLTGILAGFVGSLIYYLTGTLNVVVFGASGAIYALMFLASVMVPNSRVLLFFVFPVRLGVLILVYLAVEILMTLMNAGVSGSLVHVLGMFAAWAYCILRFRISPFKVWKNLFRR